MGLTEPITLRKLEIEGAVLLMVKTSFYFSTTMDCVFLKKISNIKNKK